jgi:hypothetical protein
MYSRPTSIMTAMLLCSRFATLIKGMGGDCFETDVQATAWDVCS